MTPLASSINDKKSKNRVTDPNNDYFISIEGCYTHVEVALFKNKISIDSIVKQDVKASSHLIPYLDTLLQKNSLTLDNLSFLAIDQGPGAFTSLRVSIATVNGIAYAHKIPLIGVHGLDALCHQTAKALINKTNTLIVCLLNAFNNDVYFSINKIQEDSINILEKNCKKIDLVLQELQEFPDRSKFTIVFTGNGAVLHQEIITQIFGKDSFSSPLYTNCSAQTIAEMALEQWEENKNPENFPNSLAPHYMKTQEFSIKKNLAK